MNWDTVKGDWKQFKGKVKEQWGKLTDDDLNRIEGKREQLAGAIEKRYGIEKDEADRQVTAFEKQCGECDEDQNRMAGESPSRQPHEKHMAGTKPMHNPQQAGNSGQRMPDKDMSGEQHEESKRGTSGQKQRSQPHGNK